MQKQTHLFLVISVSLDILVRLSWYKHIHTWGFLNVQDAALILTPVTND